jgi:hypothetical protein
MTNQLLPQTIFTNNSTADIYTSAVYYKNFVFQTEYYPHQFDGWTGTKNYGIINNRGEPIYPNINSLAMHFDRFGNQVQNINFIVDAYKEMKEYLDSHKIFTEKLQSNGSVYTDLNPQIGYLDPTKKYLESLNATYGIFFNTFLTEDRKQEIKDVYSFARYFIDFLTITKSLISINLSHFINSRACPIEANGLTISFRKQINMNDLNMKAQQFLSDPNFDVFYDAARRFGFMVDKNAPWRILADLGSSIMHDYYLRYGFRNIDDLFNRGYNIAYKTDINSLKNIFINFWNRYVSSVGTVGTAREKMGCKSLFADVVSLQQMSQDSFSLYFNDSWLIRLYVYSRMMEEDLHISQSLFEEIVEKATKMFVYVSSDSAAEYIWKRIASLKPKKNTPNSLLTEEEFHSKLVSSQLEHGPLDLFSF